MPERIGTVQDAGAYQPKTTGPGSGSEWRLCALQVVYRDIKSGVPPWCVIAEECRRIGTHIEYRSQQVVPESFESFLAAASAADAWLSSGMERPGSTPILPMRCQAVA